MTLLLPGALYGAWGGSFLVFLGACLGAEAAFLLGRTWLRDWVCSRLLAFPKLQPIGEGVSREGFKLVLLNRLSPAFPFSLLNFAYGLTTQPEATVLALQNWESLDGQPSTANWRVSSLS